ncbi:hypothetical protein HYC85_005769 [Camellia sinensis]|uniref:ZF-HD dimerization-type domain-containing protein n=1 Tax=Camellia sinensis TaxID=4442 RepID=A0A7J7I2A3_CAMSI|nr:hypothetical protein HYC85_005769 [Camellia sinensis]UOF75567.1 zinc-finger homeodomain protein 9 [Camellia sinensis var. sinensis]
METATATPTTTGIAAATVKTPEPETEAPTRVQPTKPLSSTNGVLKRHHHPLHHNHHLNGPPPPPPPPAVAAYKECLKNHAATLGGHAVDGCGEFMPSPTSISTDPTSLKCAACGCHRNFHRREPEDPPPPSTAQHVIEYQPQHRHHPPVLPRSPNSASPPPISSAYYPSAPHMLLALSAGLSGQVPAENRPVNSSGAGNPNGRKRHRTKFTQDQKERMLEFAERVGWKMQKKDDEVIAEFCSNVGVGRGVFKVWMHNNKSTSSGKKLDSNNQNSNGINTINNHHHHHHETVNYGGGNAVGTNGSSSSS